MTHAARGVTRVATCLPCLSCFVSKTSFFLSLSLQTLCLAWNPLPATGMPPSLLLVLSILKAHLFPLSSSSFHMHTRSLTHSSLPFDHRRTDTDTGRREHTHTYPRSATPETRATKPFPLLGSRGESGGGSRLLRLRNNFRNSNAIAVSSITEGSERLSQKLPSIASPATDCSSSFNPSRSSGSVYTPVTG